MASRKRKAKAKPAVDKTAKPRKKKRKYTKRKKAKRKYTRRAKKDAGTGLAALGLQARELAAKLNGMADMLE